MHNNNIIVSISCITYNQRNYIKQCFQGFLSQKTNFEYEILVHDDASNDGTVDILKKYESNYPNIFKIIYQDENQYSRGIRGIHKSFNFNRAKGKYITMCDVDDYWTDPLKLQRQVDFLEANKSFSLVCTNVEIVNNHDIVQRKRFNFKNDFEIDINYLLKRNHITTCSAMFVSERLNLKEWPKINFADKYLWLILLQNGKCFYLNEVTAVYRMNNSGVYSGLKESSKSIKRIEDYNVYKEEFPALQKKITTQIYKNLLRGIISSIKNRNYKDFKQLLKLVF